MWRNDLLQILFINHTNIELKQIKILILNKCYFFWIRTYIVGAKNGKRWKKSKIIITSPYIYHTQQHHIISIQQTSKFKANDISKILILMYVKAYYLNIAFRWVSDNLRSTTVYVRYLFIYVQFIRITWIFHNNSNKMKINRNILPNEGIKSYKYCMKLYLFE